MIGTGRGPNEDNQPWYLQVELQQVKNEANT